MSAKAAAAATPSSTITSSPFRAAMARSVFWSPSSSPSLSLSSFPSSKRRHASAFRYTNTTRQNSISHPSQRSRRIASSALPEAADAVNAASTILADVISLSSEAAASSTSTSSPSLAASLSSLASVAMMTLAELTNEATSAETRVASTIAAEVSALPPSIFTSLLSSSPTGAPPFPEPPNALSLPTWAIHVSSVAEWVVAMNLFWRLGGIEGDDAVPEWRGMSWGMTPLLGGALCACTFHFFYNSPQLAPLVALQAGLTVVGNATMWFAAYRVFRATKGRREREDAEKKRVNKVE